MPLPKSALPKMLRANLHTSRLPSARFFQQPVNPPSWGLRGGDDSRKTHPSLPTAARSLSSGSENLQGTYPVQPIRQRSGGTPRFARVRTRLPGVPEAAAWQTAVRAPGRPLNCGDHGADCQRQSAAAGSTARPTSAQLGREPCRDVTAVVQGSQGAGGRQTPGQLARAE